LRSRSSSAIICAPEPEERSMDIKQAVIRCVKDKYADFGGRAGREEFWYFMLAYFLACLVLGIVHLQVVAGLLNLALIVPSLAAGARRLHDTGKSGWFQLVWLIPLVGWILMIYWLAQPSAVANEYGEAPAPAEAASTALPPA
jgi:uncharacterized membrane protein YhaH (DUF805 family)